MATALKQSRACDALLDPLYTVSGERDHIKAAAQAGGLTLERVPQHANLFSELPHHPSCTLRVSAREALPAFVDRAFQPHQRVPQLLAWQSRRAQVTGPHLHKFFRRPLLAPGASLLLQLRLVQQPAPPAPPTPLPEPPVKDAGTQSDYRESEAQTLPWSPDVVVPTDPGVLAKQAALCARFNSSGAEILHLAHLTFGCGLPGGLQEVQRLEKLRAKRAFEAALPPLDDVARLPQRQALIEAWEVQEWAEREREIAGVHEERLALLAAALQAREDGIEAAHQARVRQRSAALMAAKAGRFAGIHAARLKMARQLAAAKAKVTASFDRRGKSTVVQQYADYASPLYAPLQREGRFPDGSGPHPADAAAAAGLTQQQPRHQGAGSNVGLASTAAQQLHPGLFSPRSVSALSELEASLPAHTLQPCVHRPQPAPAHKASYSQRAAAAARADVEAVHDMLQTAKAATGTRGVGPVWPCPLDDSVGAAAALAAAAAAAAEGRGAAASGRARTLGGSLGSNSSGGGGGAGSLSAAAAALAAAGGGGRARGQRVPGGSGKAAGSPAPAAAAVAVVAEAPPLADADGRHAALVLLQRLLRGRAAQTQMAVGKQDHLPLIRELRLGAERHQHAAPQPPAARDAATQDSDAVVGAALCRLCCLLASGDSAALTQVLLRAAGAADKPPQQQQGPGPTSGPAAGSAPPVQPDLQSSAPGLPQPQEGAAGDAAPQEHGEHPQLHACQSEGQEGGQAAAVTTDGGDGGGEQQQQADDVQA